MYYVLDNEKIVLFNESRDIIEKTLSFMPQYSGLEILETDRPIVDFEFADTPEWHEKEEQKEKERIAKLSLTKREVLLALFDDKGITPDQIKANLDDRGKIEFDYANEYFRGNPLINTLGLALGYTSEQLDYLFEHKTFPPVEEETNAD